MDLSESTMTSYEESALRYVLYWAKFIERHKHNDDQLDSEIGNLHSSLGKALEHNAADLFIKNVNSLSNYWEARGLYSIAESYLNEAFSIQNKSNERSHYVMTCINLSRHLEKSGRYDDAETILKKGLQQTQQEAYSEVVICELYRNLGSFAVLKGNYDQGLNYNKKGLAIARKIKDEVLIGGMLLNIGSLHIFLGDFHLAENYLKESLIIAKKSKNLNRSSSSLQNLGAIADRRGEYSKAAAYFEQGLQHARKINHRERICHLLTNLGGVLIHINAYEKAEPFLIEGLQIAREIQNHESICPLLINLSEIAIYKCKPQKAKSFLTEALELAQSLNHPWLLAVTLLAWGETYLSQSQLEESQRNFFEALELAKELGIKEISGEAQFGLARVAQSKSVINEARNYGKNSLKILESLNHHRTNEVRQFLNAL